MIRDIESLLALIEARQAVPFAWAQPRDCVSFANLAVQAQFGWNPLGGLTWTTKTGAARVIRRLGGIESAVDARLTAVPPAMARRGDIAGVADEDFGLLLMVIEGETLVAPGEHGLRRAPRRAMVRAWSALPPELAASD